MSDHTDKSNIEDYQTALVDSLNALGYQPDEPQTLVISRLADWASDVCNSKINANSRTLRSGVYLWGSVGRGKSLLADLLIQAIPVGLAKRYHQHEFLRDYHRTRAANGYKSSLGDVAKQLMGNATLLLLDELHVYDVADAAILNRLIAEIISAKKYVLVTANHLPESLWPDTSTHASRASHVAPLVALIKCHFEILNLSGSFDYRVLAGRNREQRYWLSTESQSFAKAQAWANNLEGQSRETSHETIAFKKLCGGCYNTADYYALVKNMRGLCLLDIPKLTARDGDAIRRLIWLVDVAWERGLPMSVVAAAPLSSLFSNIGTHLDELLCKDLKRLQSRLNALTCV